MSERNYISSFIQPATPNDYCWETFGIPRYKDYNRRATCNSYYPVSPLNEFPFKTRFQRSEKDKRKKWLLCSYYYGSMVDWIRFDLDRHDYEDIHTPDEYKDAEHEFYVEVQKLEEIADEQGFDILWTTSPGDIVKGGYCDGKHIQGLYAWIFFDRPVSVLELIRATKSLKEYHDLQSECSWDKPSQLIRPPGQRHVELCNPFNMQSKYVYDDSKPDAPLHEFNDAMYHAEPAKINTLFGVPLEWQRERDREQRERDLDVYLGIDTTPTTPTTIKPLPRKKRKAKWDMSHEYVLSCRSNLDTWDRIWNMDHTAQLIALKYKGDWKYLPKAIEEFIDRVLYISPAGSTTISFPENRRKFAERLVTYAFLTFDPTKTSGKRRIKDIERFTYCSRIDRDKFRWIVNGLLQVSEDDLNRVMEFFDYAQSHNGRVFYKVCHSIFAGKRNWERMQYLMRCKGILVTLDEYVKDDKCRQYGWSKELVKETKRIDAPSGLYHSPPYTVSISCTPTPLYPAKELVISHIQDVLEPKPLNWNTFW